MNSQAKNGPATTDMTTYTANLEIAKELATSLIDCEMIDLVEKLALVKDHLKFLSEQPEAYQTMNMPDGTVLDCDIQLAINKIAAYEIAIAMKKDRKFATVTQAAIFKPIGSWRIDSISNFHDLQYNLTKDIKHCEIIGEIHDQYRLYQGMIKL